MKIPHISTDTCEICEFRISEILEYHHIIPTYLKTDIGETLTLCPNCHRLMSYSHYMDYILKETIGKVNKTEYEKINKLFPKQLSVGVRLRTECINGNIYEKELLKDIIIAYKDIITYYIKNNKIEIINNIKREIQTTYREEVFMAFEYHNKLMDEVNTIIKSKINILKRKEKEYNEHATKYRASGNYIKDLWDISSDVFYKYQEDLKTNTYTDCIKHQDDLIQKQNELIKKLQLDIKLNSTTF